MKRTVKEFETGRTMPYSPSLIRRGWIEINDKGEPICERLNQDPVDPSLYESLGRGPFASPVSKGTRRLMRITDYPDRTVVMIYSDALAERPDMVELDSDGYRITDPGGVVLEPEVVEVVKQEVVLQTQVVVPEPEPEIDLRLDSDVLRRQIHAAEDKESLKVIASQAGLKVDGRTKLPASKRKLLAQLKKVANA